MWSEIVAAYVGVNSLPAAELLHVIRSVYTALAEVSRPVWTQRRSH